MKRADFLTKTKNIIAGRAGYRCSFPDCDRSTIGPGTKSDQFTKTGTASHIFAASEGGPRGTGGLTTQELKQPENGIWLCANHARLVDNNRGTMYPPELLLSYKNLHEARISREIQGIFSPLGWFHELRITNSPIFASETTMKLAKLNLFIGNNATGKSALCEWIASFSDIRHIERWHPPNSKISSIDVFLKFFQPNEKILQMSLDKNGHILFTDDNVTVPFNINPMKIIYLKEYHYSINSINNDLTMIASILKIEENHLLNLCRDVNCYEHSKTKNLIFKEDNEGILRLYSDVKGTAPGLPFANLSHREKECVLIELACAIARTYAKRVPTLLVLDGIVNILFDGWFDFYAKHFNDANSLFQTILVIPTQTIDTDKLSWLGWEIIRTNGKPPMVKIEQNIRAT